MSALGYSGVDTGGGGLRYGPLKAVPVEVLLCGREHDEPKQPRIRA